MELKIHRWTVGPVQRPDLVQVLGYHGSLGQLSTPQDVEVLVQGWLDTHKGAHNQQTASHVPTSDDHD